jgi:hypothetical protein
LDFFFIVGVTDQELQALLSQKDIATSFAENLLKQFENDDDLDVKPQINNRMLMDDQQQPTIKCEATSTSLQHSIAKQQLDLKLEPVIKIEKIDECDMKPKLDVHMTSKEILKYIQ